MEHLEFIVGKPPLMEKKKKEAVNDKRTLIQCLSVERAPSRLHNKYVSELKIEGVDVK